PRATRTGSGSSPPEASDDNERGSAAERALELAEHALVGRQVVVGQRVRQLLQELPLLALEMARDHDVDDDAQIAAAATAAAQRRDPLAADRQRLVGLRPGRDLEL